MNNWLLWLVIAVLAVYAYVGWKKGMVMIIASVIALVVSICITSAAAPILNNYIVNDTQIYEKIVKSTTESLKSNGMIERAIEDATRQTGISADNGGSLAELGDNFDELINEVVSKLPLPENIRDNIQESSVGGSVSSGIDSAVTGIEDVVTGFVALRIAAIICAAASYAIVFVAVYIIMCIIMQFANVVSKLPLIHQVNKGLGILFGLIKGLLVIWLFFVVLTMFYNTQFAQSVMECVNNNSFLTFLYDSNIIMKMLISASVR